MAMGLVAALPVAGAARAQSERVAYDTGAMVAGGRPHNRITGRLNKSGYTVIALAANGRARVVPAPTGVFRIVAPAPRVSLQLRDPDGKYAGPVVVGRKGAHALTGLRAGTHLGKVVIHPTYGQVAHRPPRDSVDMSRWARARHGVPIGAGHYGRVRSKLPSRPPAGDRDADGVPDVIDIDDDGDLVIDNVDRSKASPQSLAPGEDNPPEWVKAFLGSGVVFAANANAPTLVDGIGRLLPESGILMISTWPGDSVELDCGGANQSTPRTEGLVYCSTGGTGRVQTADGSNPAFPGDFDPDGNGMGNLTPWPTGDNTLMLLHGATAAQIGTGDVLVQRINNGAQTQSTATVQYVFATVPTLTSYDDGHGGIVTVPYPVLPGGAGDTEENGFPVTAGPNGHVVVRLTFWRPQRTPIPPETASWIDIGHLSYGISVGYTGDYCPISSLSNPSSTLTQTPEFTKEGGILTDQADDQPADPANTLSVTVDLTGCLDAQGVSFGQHSTHNIGISALTCGARRCSANGTSTGPDEANQNFFFTRQ